MNSASSCLVVSIISVSRLFTVMFIFFLLKNYVTLVYVLQKAHKILGISTLKGLLNEHTSVKNDAFVNPENRRYILCYHII